jgi:hypothetical protein
VSSLFFFLSFFLELPSIESLYRSWVGLTRFDSLNSIALGLAYYSLKLSFLVSHGSLNQVSNRLEAVMPFIYLLICH